jgi:hypothetical protein
MTELRVLEDLVVEEVEDVILMRVDLVIHLLQIHLKEIMVEQQHLLVMVVVEVAEQVLLVLTYQQIQEEQEEQVLQLQLQDLQ